MSDKDDEEMFQQFVEEKIEMANDMEDEDDPLHGYRSAPEFKRRDPRGYEIAKREYLANHPLG